MQDLRIWHDLPNGSTSLARQATETLPSKENSVSETQQTMLNTLTPLPVASSSSTHGYEEEKESFLPPHKCVAPGSLLTWIRKNLLKDKVKRFGAFWLITWSLSRLVCYQLSIIKTCICLKKIRSFGEIRANIFLSRPTQWRVFYS